MGGNVKMEMHELSKGALLVIIQNLKERNWRLTEDLGNIKMELEELKEQEYLDDMLDIELKERWE